MRIGGEAPGSGFILVVGICAMSGVGSPLPRIVIGSPPESPRGRQVRKEESFSFPVALSARRTQDDALQCFAGRDETPERDEQLACQGDDHRLACASSGIGSAGLVPLRQCTALLKHQKAPGELDHSAPHPGVACFGEPLLPPLGATLARGASKTGETRHRFAITHPPREHLMDEHICCFNADSDDSSQKPDHGVWPGPWLCSNRF